MTEALVRAICAEYDVKIVPGNVFPRPGETRAVATMCQILAKYGEGHYRLVMTTLSETRDNNALIEQASLWAVSDLIRACPDWVEKRTSEWLEWWDRIPLGPIMATINQLRGFSHQRHALAGAIYYRLTAFAQECMASQDTAGHIKTKVGRARSHAERDKAIDLGRKLIAIKTELPHGHFGPWVEEKSGITRGQARRYMRLAREAAQEDGRRDLGVL
ncbi:DUF3102 domain-containing protein [Rhizobium fabae]|uniref:DUF3102 domain-containing protein n=1 Tax=Rhizobium fabae TaxID=573179 RepID=A0A7W6FHE1_9HYPH|nr:DUF3102 domain-containing protein [Rhizobium fabae]MBB3913882.1 regulator of sigma D [Rhizobium fabae]RUM16302.1 DUF3102 domain-containing protein [Rhizobium fabae]